MSGMANEMADRLAQDQGAGLVHQDPASGAGPVPGNGGEAPPPAGASNTDEGAQGGQGQPPDTIPYARFKEVNDRLNSLRGFEQLREFGYDPDSLGRLATFEAEYSRDPYGTLKLMMERLDLPQELIDQVADPAQSGGDQGGGPGPSGGANQQQPQTLELPQEVKERLDYVDQIRQRDADQASAAQLARVEAAWDELDKADNIETPRMVKLMAIQTLAGSNQPFTTVEDFARTARAPLLEYRDKTLGSAVRNRTAGVTPSLPGSGPVPTEPVNFGADIKAASKAAQAAIERGEIPG